MSGSQTQVHIQCLRGLLRPLLRFCLRHSLYIQEILESVKVTLIDLAQEEIERKNEKVTHSRLSAMTGIHRRDVIRIYRDGITKDEPLGLIMRVIGQWQQDPRFTTKGRKPRVLTFEGEDSEFSQLVKSISEDLYGASVLFELERIGAVEHTRNGVKLVARAYISKEDPREGFAILSDDIEILVRAVEENLTGQARTPNLHARTEYDNISEKQYEEIRTWLLREGSALHQKARNRLARSDQDIRPKKSTGKSGMKVVLSTFSLVAKENAQKKPKKE